MLFTRRASTLDVTGQTRSLDQIPVLDYAHTEQIMILEDLENVDGRSTYISIAFNTYDSSSLGLKLMK